MTQKSINTWTNKGTLHSHGPVSIQISLWKPFYFHLETTSTHHQTTSWLTLYAHTPMPYLQNWKGSKYWDHNCGSVNILAPKQKLSFLLETEWISIPFLQWRRVLLIADAGQSPWDFLGFNIKSTKQLTQIIHKRLWIDESTTEQTSLRQRETSPEHTGEPMQQQQHQVAAVFKWLSKVIIIKIAIATRSDWYKKPHATFLINGK